MNNVVDNRLSALLGERRIKISDASRDTGISRSTLTNLYYGRGTAVSYEVLAKLCKYLNCGIGDLLHLDSGEVTTK